MLENLINQYYTEHDIYRIFKEQESIYKNKKLNDNISISKLSDNHLKKLELIATYFNTKWHNINVHLYIGLGFNTWKSFNINMLDNDRLFRLYKSYDKKIKFGFEDISIEDIQKSIDFIINTYDNITEYCNSLKSVIKQPIYDYVNNNIDCIVLSFLIESGKLQITEEEKLFMSYFVDNYENIKYVMYKNYKFINENLINNR